jgi:phosphate-selective porin OprO and OprP
MPDNRPTICTADNLNCIAITSRLNFDAGGYDYRPNTALTSPQQAQDGVNARRARIGVLGTFMGDWDYGLIYDFGGTIAKTIAAGNRRAAFGAHANSDWWWVGSYVTGPTSGFDPARLLRSGRPPAV